MAYGDDPRAWDIWKITWREEDGMVRPWTCQRLSKIAAMLRGEAGVNHPPYVRFQLYWNDPEAHHQLQDYFGSNDEFEAEIARRQEKLPEGEELNSQAVIDGLLELAKEIAWSADPDRFEEQFEERYPSEFEKLVMDGVSPARSLERGGHPPMETAERLLLYARHGEFKEPEVRLPRPKVYWQASETVERRDQDFDGDEEPGDDDSGFVEEGA